MHTRPDALPYHVFSAFQDLLRILDKPWYEVFLPPGPWMTNPTLLEAVIADLDSLSMDLGAGSVESESIVDAISPIRGLLSSGGVHEATSPILSIATLFGRGDYVSLSALRSMRELGVPVIGYATVHLSESKYNGWLEYFDLILPIGTIRRYDYAFNRIVAWSPSEWTLRVDADEVIHDPQAWRAKLRGLEGGLHSVYGLERRESTGESDTVHRVWRRGCGIRFYGAVHERPDRDFLRLLAGQGKLGHLEVTLLHSLKPARRRAEAVVRDLRLAQEELLSNPSSLYYRFVVVQSLEGEFRDTAKAALLAHLDAGLFVNEEPDLVRFVLDSIRRDR